METFTAKYNGVLPRTPYVRPKSEIYAPKRDNEHLQPFHMRSPSPGFAPLRQRRFDPKNSTVMNCINVYMINLVVMGFQMKNCSSLSFS